jgi:hypothetical protein
MNTETMPASGVAAEQVTPVENVIEQPEVTTPESNEAEQQPQEKPEQDDSDKSLKRLQRRVDRVTAARYQAEARAQQLEAQLAQFQQQTQPEGKQEAPQVDPYKLAEEIATAKQITDRSNSTFSDGVKAYGDAFKASVSAVIDEAGPLINDRGMPTALGEAVLDSDKPADLLHYLGQNPDIAESLHGLSAARLGRRIEAIERDMKASRVSKAPAPLQPVTPKGAPIAKAESSMSDAEWYAARRKRS